MICRPTQYHLTSVLVSYKNHDASKRNCLFLCDRYNVVEIRELLKVMHWLYINIIIIVTNSRCRAQGHLVSSHCIPIPQ